MCGGPAAGVAQCELQLILQQAAGRQPLFVFHALLLLFC